ncbi:hypothetical protein RB195_022470 [Necator americanus]|uniref:Uncharacterized protein n=1 Tax=Necator americanus TaxID=51031 RepID=A0ABR1EGE3_NECAM
MNDLQADCVGSQMEGYFSQFSVLDLIALIKGGNQDPVIEAVLQSLTKKIPIKLADCAEADVCGRTIVISGGSETDKELFPLQDQFVVESKVSTIVDVLNLNVTPQALFTW